MKLDIPFQFEADTVEITTKKMDFAAFCRLYQDRERFLPYCRECPNYGTVWSCPPLPFDTGEYFRPYEKILVFCARITLDPAVIERADTPELVKKTGYEIVIRVKKRLEDYLRELEARFPQSRSLSSGGCNRCCRCARAKGESCRKPDVMRYSLDAFGFDLTAITKDLFGYDIEWCRDRLPAHFTLIHALLLSAAVSSRFAFYK
ncbi:DUF2284 domain-containing protein [uncultured Mitsuokella sp.]|uniref:DUF2284 domain-containing protein n=1 Tax=uncultured Mitsuokella sp. TaxID=453120 RepID=UPI00261A3919|nr:DUF2284 domain-containing protein [uncultured Mitsuokella sp.]